MPPPPLLLQTTYAELLERSEIAAFKDAFHEDGAFTSKTVRGRRYWYFQASTRGGRVQKYVGPETPALLEQIARHKESRDDENERRTLVTTLTRSFRIPPSLPQTGDIIALLAEAGVFRLRSVLVGTVAYQTYAAMLGVKMRGSSIRTGDIDIAQFKTISVAVEDQTPPMLDVLKAADKSFEARPNSRDDRRTTAYVARGGLLVEFLTPNEGSETEAPQTLPALQTDAQPLRYLDFLIREPVSAVILHGAGIHVQVPAPERYALHKLIVSRLRRDIPKRDKDIEQADSLLGHLAAKYPHDVKKVWDEAQKRGPKWRRLIAEGMEGLSAQSRDLTLKIAGATRDLLPAMDLTFDEPPFRYDLDRDLVFFEGRALNQPVRCAISLKALDDDFGAPSDLTGAESIKLARQHRQAIEHLARVKFLHGPVEEPGAVLIKPGDKAKLLKPFSDPARPNPIKRKQGAKPRKTGGKR